MNDNRQSETDNRLFELLAREPGETDVEKAPSRLKAQLYTALIQKQQESGRLRTLAETRNCGHELCIFEGLWEQMVKAQGAQSFNCCSVCHARVLAEHLERPPIYWGHCPYVAFARK